MLDEIYEFYTGHAIKMLEISRRTIYRWLKSGKIVSERDIIGNHKFTLREINRMRVLRGLDELSRQDAHDLWERLYTTEG